jgi:hypothetical protein
MLREFFAKFLAMADSQDVAPTSQVRIENVPVRSATEPYNFGFSCTVGYHQTQLGTQSHAALPEVARNGILQRVAPVAAAARLTETMVVQAQLATQLGLPSHDPSGRLRVWATDVVLTAAEADVQAVHQRHELQRKMQVWQYEKEIERRERDFTAEMLIDPKHAVAWWLSRNPQQVAQAVGMIEPIALLSAAIHGRPTPDTVELSAEDQLLAAAEQLFAPLDEFSRALLGDQLAKLLATFGQADLAALVRQRLDTPGAVV